MIKEIKSKTKVAKEIIFQCDSCFTFYCKNYKHFYLEKEYHFCSKKCSDKEKKLGGLIGLKFQKTCINTYGVENPFQVSLVKEKIKNSHIKKYGVENISQSTEIKQIKRNTCLQNYGSESPLQSLIVKNKVINTLLKNYGVINPSRNLELFEKAQQNMKGSHKTGYIEILNKSIFYRSSYEKLFLSTINNFSKKYPALILDTNIPINYFFNGKSRKYFADFLIKLYDYSILFEIKPNKLISTKQNILKFEAAQKFIIEHDIKHFAILTEKELFNDSFLEIYFKEFL